MSNEHGLTLLESEMDDIISICREIDQKHLLDDFAKAAMQGMLINNWANLSVSDEAIAKEAYGIATAMMQERERRTKG